RLRRLAGVGMWAAMPTLRSRRVPRIERGLSVLGGLGKHPNRAVWLAVQLHCVRRLFQPGSRRGIVMARQTPDRDISSTLAAAEQWIRTCLIEDGSLFSHGPLWTAELVGEVRHAFVDHPDLGTDNFVAKLKGQMKTASPPAQHLMAEMLWALLLFPSNM